MPELPIIHRLWSDPDAAQTSVVAAMNTYLPSDELEFLMDLSIEPVAPQLALE